jgi:hypothetical protein
VRRHPRSHKFRDTLAAYHMLPPLAEVTAQKTSTSACLADRWLGFASSTLATMRSNGCGVQAPLYGSTGWPQALVRSTVASRDPPGREMGHEERWQEEGQGCQAGAPRHAFSARQHDAARDPSVVSVQRTMCCSQERGGRGAGCGGAFRSCVEWGAKFTWKGMLVDRGRPIQAWRHSRLALADGRPRAGSGACP